MCGLTRREIFIRGVEFNMLFINQKYVNQNMLDVGYLGFNNFIMPPFRDCMARGSCKQISVFILHINYFTSCHQNIC